MRCAIHLLTNINDPAADVTDDVRHEDGHAQRPPPAGVCRQCVAVLLRMSADHGMLGTSDPLSHAGATTLRCPAGGTHIIVIARQSRFCVSCGLCAGPGL